MLVGPSLEVLKRRAQQLRRGGVADSTWKSRVSHWKCYKNFCNLYGLNYRTCSVDQLSCFIAFLSSRMRASSIVTYLQALIFMARLKCYRFPDLSSARLYYLISGVKRAKIFKPFVRDPVLVSHLLKMYHGMSFRSLIDVQFWAACLLMFRALLRVSNIVGVHALKCADVVFTSWGLLLYVNSSKCSSELHVIPIAAVNQVSLCPVFWTRLTLKNRVSSAVIFSELSYNIFRKKLKLLLSQCNISDHLSSHSFRSGGATCMAALGIPVLEIKERGGWKSDCIFKYIKEPLSYRVAKEQIFASRF